MEDNKTTEENGSFEFVDEKVVEEELLKKDEKNKEKKDIENTSELGSTNTGDWEDILGSGHLLKKVIKEGLKDSRPERADICEVKYECYVDDKIVEKVESQKVHLGDCEVIQGLELAIPLMNIGEVVQLKISSRFAFGSVGLPPNIPPNSALQYTIELLSTSPEVGIESMDVNTRGQIGNRKKERGNWWYARGENHFAAQCYKRALEYLDYLDDENDDFEVPKTEADLLIEDRMKVYNNLAAAQMKLEQYDAALSSVERVLICQPNNTKALFRKGKILYIKNNIEEAVSCMKKALGTNPGAAEIKAEINKLQTKLKSDFNAERELYKKMLNNRPEEKNLNDSSVAGRWAQMAMIFGVVSVAVAAIFAYKFKYGSFTD